MEFFKNFLKGSSCGCKKTRKHSGKYKRSGYKRSGKNKRISKKQMRGGYSYKKSRSSRRISRISSRINKPM